MELKENWQMNDSTTIPLFTNPLRSENTETNAEPTPQSLLEGKQFQNVLITKDDEPDSITGCPGRPASEFSNIGRR